MGTKEKLDKAAEISVESAWGRCEAVVQQKSWDGLDEIYYGKGIKCVALFNLNIATDGTYREYVPVELGVIEKYASNFTPHIGVGERKIVMIVPMAVSADEIAQQMQVLEDAAADENWNELKIEKSIAQLVNQVNSLEVQRWIQSIALPGSFLDFSGFITQIVLGRHGDFQVVAFVTLSSFEQLKEIFHD